MDSQFPLEDATLNRRQLLNFLTGATVAVTTGAMLYPVLKFFTPTDAALNQGASLAKAS
jgi:cytochrome b6-f complex iron-sulfur subunit